MTEKRVSKRGRVNEGCPSKYKPEYCSLLTEHLSKGYSYETFIAQLPEVATKKSLYDWEKAHPEFLIAKKRGLALSLQWWEEMGVKLMSGVIRGGAPNIWIFVMKCRFSYIDTITDISSLPTEQIVELAKKALEKIENE